jgi:hypothetical protein
MEYYTYAYLREDGTPYYIGKGKGNRAHNQHKRKGIGFLPVPPKDRIIKLKQNLTEEEAFKHEVYMISVFGRKDLGTGILINLTNGGEGPSGAIPWNIGKKLSQEIVEKIRKKATGRILDENTKQKMSKSHKGIKHTEETKKLISQKQLGKNNHNSQYIWIFTFESGEVVKTSSMPSWCKNNGYDKAALMRVCKGQVGRHKDIVAVEKVAHNPFQRA